MNIIPVFFSNEQAYFLLSKIFCGNQPIKYEILCGYDKEIESLAKIGEIVVEEYRFIILSSSNIGREFESIENSIIRRVPIFISFLETQSMLDLHLRNAISSFLNSCSLDGN